MPINRCELDSHADTVVAGDNFRMIVDTGKHASVSGFTTELGGVKSIPIGSCATLYTCPTTGQFYNLVCHQSLYFRAKLGAASLLNPNQLRFNGVGVFDTPKQFDKDSLHAIVAEGLTIPLDMLGVCSGFESRQPTDRELENCPRIDLTSDLEWDPSSDFLASREEDAIRRTVRRVQFAPAQEVEPPVPDPGDPEVTSDPEVPSVGQPESMVATSSDEQQERMIAEYNHQRSIQAVNSYRTYDRIDPWDLLCEEVTTVEQLPD
jgi:hypothetical protein